MSLDSAASQLRVVRLELGRVTLPAAHPRAADGSCVIFGFAIAGPDGVVVVDTGPREGHPIIDEMYAPSVISIVDALHGEGLDERDVIAVVNSHLHFDHCGQNHLLPDAPVWVAEAEVVAAAAEFYTVPEWAHIEAHRLRLGRDGEEVAPGVSLLHTPGHTPGHVSVATRTANGLELVVGQACYSCAEFASGQVADTDMQSDDWIAVGRKSLDRLRGLGARRAHFSHDTAVYLSP